MTLACTKLKKIEIDSAHKLTMGEVNSVVETAVERTSWGKSRNELLCRFHNSGGLHRISGDAPLETRILTHEENHINSRIIDIPGVVNKLQLDGRSTSCVKINGANTDMEDLSQLISKLDGYPILAAR